MTPSGLTHVNFSGKAKKSTLVEARARKAARVVPTPHPLDAAELASRPALSGLSIVQTASSRPSGVQRFRTVEEREKDDAKASRFKLESRFLRLPLELLNHHRVISATAPLTRPIDESMGVLRVTEFQPEELEGLSCPKRPKWSYHQTKLEVEKNEEGVFRNWLKATDDLLGSFSRCASFREGGLRGTMTDPGPVMQLARFDSRPNLLRAQPPSLATTLASLRGVVHPSHSH